MPSIHGRWEPNFEPISFSGIRRSFGLRRTILHHRGRCGAFWSSLPLWNAVHQPECMLCLGSHPGIPERTYRGQRCVAAVSSDRVYRRILDVFNLRVGVVVEFQQWCLLDWNRVCGQQCRGGPDGGCGRDGGRTGSSVRWATFDGRRRCGDPTLRLS